MSKPAIPAPSVPAPSARAGEARRGRAWAFAAIFVLTLLAYLPAIRGGFIWDDDRHVTKPELRSLEGLRRIWFEVGATQQYYPVLHTAFWLEHKVWGDAPIGYHLVNVLLHATAACLFGLVLSGLIAGRAGPPAPPGSPVAPGGAGGPALPWPWLAALLFALHPVCVESVAWISEQKNTLSTVFYLLAALAYLRFDEGRIGARRAEAEPSAESPARLRPLNAGSAAAVLYRCRDGKDRRPAATYGLATGLFVLALLSKSVTATLPAALLVVIWWKRGRLEWKRDIPPLIPWLAVGVSAGLFTAWVERRYIGAEGASFDLSWLERGLLAGRVIWFYLGKLLWPANLIFIYPRWQVSAAAARQYLWPAGVLVLLALLWRERRRSRGPLAGFLFFAGSLVPALGFVNVYPFVYSYVADHFQYLASLGIMALAAGAWGAGLRRGGGKPGLYAAAAAVLLLGALTWRQCHAYRNAETLYRTTLVKNPGCWMAEVNLGKILHESGRTAESISHYEAGVRLHPWAQSHYDLGNALQDEGRFEEAETQYEEALRQEPNYVDAQVNLALVLANQGRLAEAAEHDELALRLRPDFAETHNNLGNVYYREQRLGAARAEFEQALRLRPDYAKARNGLGGVYFRGGQMPEAARQFEAAIRLDPAYAEAHLNLGVVLLRLGRVPEAMAECEEALRLRPGFAAARTLLGRLQAWRQSHGAPSSRPGPPRD